MKPQLPADLHWDTWNGKTVVCTEQKCVLDTVTPIRAGFLHEYSCGAHVYTTEGEAMRAAADRHKD